MSLVKVKLLEKISPYSKGEEIEMREDLALGEFSEKVEVLEKLEKKEEVEEETEKKDIKKAKNKAILKNKETKDVEGA